MRKPLLALAVSAFGIGTSEFIIMGLLPDLARSFHAHPTLPEAMKEAALAVEKRAIHM